MLTLWNDADEEGEQLWLHVPWAPCLYSSCQAHTSKARSASQSQCKLGWLSGMHQQARPSFRMPALT